MRGFGKNNKAYESVIAVMLFTCCAKAWSITVPPGTSVTVTAADPVQQWGLSNGASLQVSTGGRTLDITANPISTVTLDGASVSAAALPALVLYQSTGIITGSTLTSTGNIGLSAILRPGQPGTGSTVTVNNSVISGAGRGVNVSAGSTVTLTNSQITGSGAVGGSIAGNGLGISLVGGEAIVRGSQVTGSNHGAGVFANVDTGPSPHLLLDASTLTSGTGSAILVGNLSGPPMVANIEVLNGSTITAANGVLLEVGLATSPASATTSAQLTVDNSKLTGDVQVLTGSTANVLMRNSATLTGTMTNISSLDMNNSQVTGNIVEPAGALTPVNMAAGSVFTGTMTNIGSLDMNNSQMTGDVVESAGALTPVNIAAGSVFTGSMTNIGSLDMNSSQMMGNIVESAGASTPVNMAAGSVFIGNMTNIGSLDMNNSQMTGDVVEPAGASTRVNMAAGSAFTGSMTNVGSLDMNSSQMTGNVVEQSGASAAVNVAAGSTLTGSLNNIASLNVDNSVMSGDVVQDAQTPALLSLSNGGRLTGTVTGAASGAQSMTVDSTSVFNMVNDSSVGALTLSGGTVNLRGGNGAFRTLTASSLTGNGTFALGSDLAGHLSDLVNITGNASGSHTLSIQNTGVEPIQEDHAQQVVHTGSGAASFAVLGGQVDAGTFVYRLQQRGTDWYLVQATTDPGGGTGEEPGDGGPGGDEGDGGEDPVITPSAKAVIAIFSAAPTVWYGELATLRSRMGELRDGHEQGGFWARTYGNKYNVSADDQVHYSQTQQGISFGADASVSSNGRWLVGVMGGYSNSELNQRQGSDGQVNSYYVGLYSTWLADDGYYIDAILKANRFHNKADTTMSDGARARGDYKNYGVGGSVEVGKHVDLSEGWFIEPYLQASALWVEGDHYSLDNGLEARARNADSFLGKAGTYVGRSIRLQSGSFIEPYVKLALAHEFAKNNEVRVNDTTFSDDLSGSRGEVGAGVAAKITDVLQVHADIDYSNGKNIEQPWGVNVGVRYSW
jgi:outer membrane autotransporter protein